MKGIYEDRVLKAKEIAAIDARHEKKRAAGEVLPRLGPWMDRDDLSYHFLRALNMV